MTPEEREAMEAAKNEMNEAGPSGAAAASAAAPGAAAAGATPATPTTATTATFADADAAHKGTASGTATPTADSASATGSGTELTHHNKEKAEAAERKAAKHKLTAEQKAKLEELDAQKEAERRKRIEQLTEKLKDRIRPFVDAKHPGDDNDPETQAFIAKTKTEAEDLKLESFGVEMLHTIAGVYVTRAGNFIKSKRFFGGGFIGRLKEKGGMVKEGWGLLGSA